MPGLEETRSHRQISRSRDFRRFEVFRRIVDAVRASESIDTTLLFVPSAFFLISSVAGTNLAGSIDNDNAL